MSLKSIHIISSLTVSINLFAFESELYQQQRIDFYSGGIGEKFILECLIPSDFESSSNLVSYPLILLFDCHNENTYQHHLRNIDIMTYHGQIPESIVVGIPFSPHNRYYLTSMSRREGENVSGLERLETMIFDELIPHFQFNFKATGPIAILGHSRTAYATKWLMTRNHQSFNAAGAFSGFLEKGFRQSDFHHFIEETRSRSIPFQLYLTSGIHNPEEETYLKDLLILDSILIANEQSLGLKALFFTHPFAGHMMNYNLSLPAMLLDFFGPYSQILTELLFDESVDWEKREVEVLESRFERLKTQTGQVITPRLVHFISLSNMLAQSDNNEGAMTLAIRGLEYYPTDYDLHWLAIHFTRLSGKNDDATDHWRKVVSLLENDTSLTSEQKTSIMDEFEELFEE